MPLNMIYNSLIQSKMQGASLKTKPVSSFITLMKMKIIERIFIRLTLHYMKCKDLTINVERFSINHFTPVKDNTNCFNMILFNITGMHINKSYNLHQFPNGSSTWHLHHVYRYRVIRNYWDNTMKSIFHKA